MTESRRTDGRTAPEGFRAVCPPTQGILVLAETESVVAAPLIDAAALIGIDVVWCRDGADALLAVGAHQPNVLVIAAQTETVDAQRISTTVRSHSEVPILVGAAPGEEALARQVLAAGASAVVVRPYDITAIAPFAVNPNLQSTDEPALFVAGPIRVDRRGYETRVHDRYVDLTQRELDLLVFLIEHRGSVTSSEEISEAVWGHPSETNTVAVHVKRLRKKLGDDPVHGEYIRTVRGAGYRLAPSISA